MEHNYDPDHDPYRSPTDHPEAAKRLAIVAGIAVLLMCFVAAYNLGIAWEWWPEGSLDWESVRGWGKALWIWLTNG